MVRFGRGSAERTLIFLGLFFLGIINYIYLRAYSNSNSTNNQPPSFHMLKEGEDAMLYIKMEAKREIVLRYPSNSDDAKRFSNLIEVKSFFDSKMEKELRGRSFSKVFVQFSSFGDSAFFTRLLRVVEPFAREEINFLSNERGDRDRMEIALDLFVSTRRAWNIRTLSRFEQDETQRFFGFVLNPIADWDSKEMDAIQWIQYNQFPEDCKQREKIRYSGYNSQNVVDVIYAETWPLIHALSSEKTLVSTFEENIQAQECSKSSLDCYFLPFTSCSIGDAEEVTIMRGFNDSPEWNTKTLQGAFPDQSGNWILSQLIRFLVRPSKDLRKAIDNIKNNMQFWKFISYTEDNKNSRSKCSIIYYESEPDLVRLSNQAAKKGYDRIFLLSKDMKIAKNPPDQDRIKYYQYQPQKELVTSREQAYTFLSYAFAATEHCDVAFTTTSNYGRFIHHLLYIRTNDQSHLNQLVSLGEAILQHQTSDFSPKPKHDGKIKFLPTSKPFFNRTKVATIIEERPQPHLIPVIAHFMQVVPPDWPFIIWHSPKNIDMLLKSNMIQREIKSGKLDLRPLPSHVSLSDGESMSRFLTKPWFWEQFEAEHILFFQTDSMFCAQSEQSVEDYVGYDYVGAPWPFYPEVTGGNGGLSLRRKSAILKVLSENSRPDNGKPEDLWYSIQLAPKGNLPPNDKAAKFSVENPFLPNPQRPLGFHRGGVIPQEWKIASKFQEYASYCPEIRMFHDPPR